VPAVEFGLFSLLLVFTRYGDDVPFEMKIGAPVFFYMVTVWFLLTHRGEMRPEP
jgi:hypothetical protein